MAFEIHGLDNYLRRALIGSLAGLAASYVLVITQETAARAIVLGVLVGIVNAVAFRSASRAYADSAMTAAALGVPAWIVFGVIVIPLFHGEMPEWTGGEMRALSPEFIGWILYGSVLGLVTQALSDVALARFGPEPTPAETQVPEPKHIVILGGGFTGMTTAQNLEEVFGPDRSVVFTLVSETNALLFTPMLAEVAGSSLEPSHISAPLRTSLRRTHVLRGRVSEVDLEGRRIQVTVEGGGVQELVYDQVVFALGAISNYLGLKNVQELAFNFRSLLDAIRIRNHVIEMFEQADRETDPELRREKLTFVIAGGGFAGVELAGALNDFSRGILAVWTAGTAPNALLRTLPVETDGRGAVIVENTMAVPGHPGLWAAGDCAALKDGKTGNACPPTAQFALREAHVLARNLRAVLQGRAPEPFHFDSLGALCVVGHHTACAEMTVPFARGRSIRFRGLFAWLLWRGIYLGKLPGLERKIRVLSDWVIELFFPRDIVQTIELK
jgi:NADH dehydrogenase FAD-containing subunit/uncharacterized membrane protein YagU involved in acid resistance